MTVTPLERETQVRKQMCAKPSTHPAGHGTIAQLTNLGISRLGLFATKDQSAPDDWPAVAAGADWGQDSHLQVCFDVAEVPT